MRWVVLSIIRKLGRFTAVLLAAAVAAAFAGWLHLVDQRQSMLFALVLLPVMLPLAMASVALLLGVVLAGWQRGSGPYASRSEAPGLWRMWDELGPAKWGQKRLIALNDQFNASISERSRFFGLGFPEVVMTVGLPMLHVLDEPQVRAVVAHEVGHDACKHTLGGANIAAFERAFQMVFYAFPARTTVTGSVLYSLLGGLGDWLSQEELRLSRLAERQADARAGQAIGRERLATSLAVFSAHAERYRETITKPIYEGLDKLMHVPPSPMEVCLHDTAPQSIDDLMPFAHAAFAKPHDPKSTHPVLSEGLAALGYDQLPQLEPLGPSALAGLVSPSLVAEVRSYYGTRWHANVSRYLNLA